MIPCISLDTFPAAKLTAYLKFALIQKFKWVIQSFTLFWDRMATMPAELFDKDFSTFDFRLDYIHDIKHVHEL